MRKLSMGAAVAILTATTSIAAATPASANSISGSLQGGSFSYSDGADRFCIRAVDHFGGTGPADIAWELRVTLTPFDKPGPTRTFRDYNDDMGIQHRGHSCRSLSTAYEDTHYRAVITSYLLNRPDLGVMDRVERTFHS